MARPVGDGAAGAADDGDEGGDVPRVHDGIDADIHESSREKKVAVAIRPSAVESGGVDETVAGGAVLIAGEIAMVAGDEGGFGQGSRGAGAHGLAVEGGGRIVADDELTEGGLVDGAEDGLAVVEEADEGRPERDPGDEAFGAVDGIEDPNPFRVGVQVAVFFADDAVGREMCSNEVAHDFLGAAIGGRHG